MNFTYRKAKLEDERALTLLIEKSARTINAVFYTKKEIQAALGKVWTVDKDLINDNTYWAVENDAKEIIGCGGWSKRNILFGKKESKDAENNELNPKTDSARIRAFFVDPDYKRMGIGKRLLELCKEEAKAMDFHSMELVATLSGVKLYEACGFTEKEIFKIDLGNGITNKVVSMYKAINI